MKFRLVEDFYDLLLEGRPSVIEPGSDLEKAIINDLKNTDKSYKQIGKEYSISGEVIRKLAIHKNLRNTRYKPLKVYVYFNTLEADIQGVSVDRIRAQMKFQPSIYIGQYSISIVSRMYEYIKDKYCSGSVNNKTLIEFYLKIASNEISLNTLVSEMMAQSSPFRLLPSNDYKFITASVDELPTVDFYSTNYSQLAKDVLTFLGRKVSSPNEFATVYKDLKTTAAKLDPETYDMNNHIDTYINNNLENIAHNIYSKKGDIIEAANYINGIPYEIAFDISSPQDIARCLDQYKNYLLYGFMSKTDDIVYIGISIAAESRGDYYENENRPLIMKAFEDDIIKKLIIFKSNLPTHNRTLNTKLIHALEVYFAEVLFNTYPENYPKALNKQKPGQNSSRFLASQRRQDFEKYISKQDSLLSNVEFSFAAKEILKISRRHKDYPYYKYAEDYIAKHDSNLSIKDKKILYKSLDHEKMYILWDICSSESEYIEIVAKNKDSKHALDAWKNYRIKNNLPITEDLDDDIDMEYYV